MSVPRECIYFHVIHSLTRLPANPEEWRKKRWVAVFPLPTICEARNAVNTHINQLYHQLFFLPTLRRVHRGNAFVIVTVIDGSKLAFKMCSLHVFLKQFLPLPSTYNPFMHMWKTPATLCENICQLSFDRICAGRLTCFDLPSKRFLSRCTKADEIWHFIKHYQVFIHLLR